jgi:hypothetical protein
MKWKMVSLATPILEELSRETGESAHFSVRLEDAVVVLARTGGKGAFQLTDRAGAVRPAHCTALGKIMLAVLTPDQFEQFLVRADLQAHTPKSIISVDVLRREISEVRRSGVAMDDGEFDAEVRCAALPVRDFSGPGHRYHRHFRAGLAAVDGSLAKTRAKNACSGRSSFRGIRLCSRTRSAHESSDLKRRAANASSRVLCSPRRDSRRAAAFR